MKKKYEPKANVEGYTFSAKIAGRDEPFEPSFPYETEDVHEQRLLDAQSQLKSSSVKEASAAGRKGDK